MKLRYIIRTKLNILEFSSIVTIALFLIIAWAGCTRKEGKLSSHSNISAMKKEFDENSAKTNKALEKYVPQEVSSILNQQYDGTGTDGRLDVYFPSEAEKTGKALPVIVWMHGGGWISGDKAHIASYCKILAAKGYTTVSINYPLAPESTYPTPVRQANKALAYLGAHAQRLHIDTSHFVLAGDSGGASIAAQLANAISVPAYARDLDITPAIPRTQLSGVILYCGPYELADSKDKRYSQAVKPLLTAYSGSNDYASRQDFATFKVVRYVTAAFPPAFISAGNADALLTSSQDLARTLSRVCVKVDTVFFAPGHQPAQNHEYQFNLDTDEANIALNRSLIFLSGLRIAKK